MTERLALKLTFKNANVGLHLFFFFFFFLLIYIACENSRKLDNGHFGQREFFVPHTQNILSQMMTAFIFTAEFLFFASSESEETANKLTTK